MGEMLSKRKETVQENNIFSAADMETEADRISAGVTSETPEGVKRQMGRRMGADFSGVRFHIDKEAAQKAAAIGARAFTRGNDIYFGQGGFDGEIASHELVHTAQQGEVASDMSTMSADAGSVQMWPWSKKKKEESAPSWEEYMKALSVNHMLHGSNAAEAQEAAQAKMGKLLSGYSKKGGSNKKLLKKISRDMKKLNKENENQGWNKFSGFMKELSTGDGFNDEQIEAYIEAVINNDFLNEESNNYNKGKDKENQIITRDEGEMDKGLAAYQESPEFVNALLNKTLDYQEAVEAEYQKAFERALASGKSKEEAEESAKLEAMSTQAGTRLRRYRRVLDKQTNEIAMDYMERKADRINNMKQKDKSEWTDEEKKEDRSNKLGEKYQPYLYGEKKDIINSANPIGYQELGTSHKEKKQKEAQEARKRELSLNNFANDPDLPRDIFGATTSDIAAYKMLQNLKQNLKHKPEMLNDPEFCEQLNKFVGGNAASFLSTTMFGKDGAGKKNAFRGNQLAMANTKTLQNMYLPMEKMEKFESYLNLEGSDEADRQVGVANGFQYLMEHFDTEGSAGKHYEGRMANLFGNIAQGMNGQGFSDNERSAMMMNHFTLRNIAPYLQLKVLNSTTEDEKRKYKRASGEIQKIVNKPETFYDPEFMNNVNNYFSPSTMQRDDMSVPQRGMSASKKEAAPAISKGKKHKWQFWKRKKTQL